MSNRPFRLVFVLGALLLAQGLHAMEPDDGSEDEDEDRPTTQARVAHADTAKARYEARMAMLNAQLTHGREYCKAIRASGADYCTKEVDQKEYEGRFKIQQAYKDELAKEQAAKDK